MDDQTIFLLASKDFYRRQVPYRDASGYHFPGGQKQIIDELESAGLRNLAAKKSQFDKLKSDTELQTTIYDQHLALLNNEFKGKLSAKETQVTDIRQCIGDKETEVCGFRDKCAERGFNLDDRKSEDQPVTTPHSSKPKWGLALLLVLIEVIVNIVSFLALREFLSQDQVWMRIGGNIIIIILLFYADYTLAAKQTAVKVTYFMVGTLLLLSSIFGSIVLNEYFPVGQVSDSVWAEAGNATTNSSIPKIVGFYRALPIELILCSILLMVLTKIGADKKSAPIPVKEVPVKKHDPDEEARQILRGFKYEKNQLQAALNKAEAEMGGMRSEFKQVSETLITERERVANDLKRAEDALNTFSTQVAMDLKRVFDALKTYEHEYRGLNTSMAAFDSPTEDDILNYFSIDKTLTY